MSKIAIGTTEGGRAFSLPVEAATETFAILAKKGYGKSYTSDVLIEGLLKANQQVVIIDPTGAHWGLQSSADGKSEGFPIVVFGGDHANVPLEESAGEVVARAIVEKGFSAIIDVSLFRKGVANRFVGIFLETLYRLNREPLLLVIDEADSYAPQRLMGDEARTCGAAEDIVKKGRIRGIGCVLITQRPQTLNKNVLSQVDTLICGNLSHPKDIGAIEEWIDVHADPKEAKAMVASLPVLPKGTLWFWSPSWGEFFDKVKVRERITFNSGATPKPGEKIRAPQKLAPVDIEALGRAISETVERKNAEDPKRLRARIAELEKQANQKTVSVKDATPNQSAIDRAVKSAVGDRDRFWKGELQKAIAAYDQLRRKIERSFAAFDILQVFPKIELPKLPSVENPKAIEDTTRARDREGTPAPVSQLSPRPAPARASSNAGIGGPEQKILNSLAWYEAIGLKNVENAACAFMAGYTLNGSYYNARGKLNASGLIQYLPNDRLMLMDGGRLLAVAPDAPGTPEELHSRVMSKLGGPERRVLQPILDAYPDEIGAEELAEKAGYTMNGSFYNARGKLRTLGLIEYPSPNRCIAKDLLFLK